MTKNITMKRQTYIIFPVTSFVWSCANASLKSPFPPPHSIMYDLFVMHHSGQHCPLIHYSMEVPYFDWKPFLCHRVYRLAVGGKMK